MPKRSIGKILTRVLAVAAIAVVAGFATLTLSDTSALARGGHGGMGHVSGRAFSGGRAGFAGRPFVGRPFVGRPFVGRPFAGRGRFIRGRHFWHGRWWWPGVGPCWQWTPWGWIWVCGP